MTEHWNSRRRVETTFSRPDAHADFPASRRNVINGEATVTDWAVIVSASDGTGFAVTRGSMLRVSCNAVLIAAACLVTAAKLHDRGVGLVLTSHELNRCLSVLRAAAAAKSLEDATGKRTRRTRTLER